MKRKKIRSILFFALIFVFAMGIIFAPSLKKFYKENISKKYSEGNIEYFDLNLFGATGWAGIDLPLKETSNNSSNTLTTVSAGQPFMILGIDGDYWEIMYGNNHGYVEHDYCLINLPDVLTKARYDIKNAYGSVYRTKGERGPQGAQISIPDVTGEVLYGTNCYDGNNSYKTCTPIDEDGMVMNNRLQSDEFIVPVLYSTSLQIAKGADAAENEGYRLKIIDSYRPYDVSAYVSTKFKEMYNNPSNSGIRSMIETSYNNADNAPDGSAAAVTWNVDDGWFISNVNSGTHVSDHNVGAAIDVTLCQIGNVGETETCDDVQMYSPIHQLSTDSIKYSHPIPTANPEQRNSDNYSVRMNNDENAKKLDTYLQTGAGMDTLSSEWWHFRDADGVGRMKTATSNQGFNFQATSIVSDYGFSDHITVKGDANGNGSLDLDDAELVYKFYSFLNDGGVCETCTNLVSKLDITEDGEITGDDIYAILKVVNHEVNGGINLVDYNFSPYRGWTTDDFINLQDLSEFDEDRFVFADLPNLTFETNNDDTKLYIKYHNSTIKTLELFSYEYENHEGDLAYWRIFIDDGTDPFEKISDDINSGKFVCHNCSIVLDQENEQIKIMTGENDSMLAETISLIYYTSHSYDITNYVNSLTDKVPELLDSFTCHNCEVHVYSGDTEFTTGDLPLNAELVLKETLTANNYELKRVPIRFATLGVELDITEVNLGVGEQQHLTATALPVYATDKSISWSSSDEDIVRVNSNGTITGVSSGTATITAKYSNDNNIYATCTVTVISKNTVTYIWGSGNNDQAVYYYEEGNDVIAGFNQPELLYVQGKKLVGWQYNGATYALNEILEMPSEDIELTAVWEEISDGVDDKYTISKISNTVRIITGFDLNPNVTDVNLGLDISEYIVTIHGPSGNEIKTGILGTGDIIKVWVGDKVVDKYDVSIKYDLTGDGLFTFDDAVLAYRGYFTSYQDMKECVKRAADADNNNVSDFNDFVLLYKKYFAGE